MYTNTCISPLYLIFSLVALASTGSPARFLHFENTRKVMFRASILCLLNNLDSHFLPTYLALAIALGFDKTGCKLKAENLPFSSVECKAGHDNKNLKTNKVSMENILPHDLC